MRIFVTGSIAYDYIMVFPGRFRDHILPDKMHVLSVSFLVDSLKKRRGGTAANIAYNLALLGGGRASSARVGEDFAEYREWLEGHGVDTSAIKVIAGEHTASCFINTDLQDNQITAFYPARWPTRRRSRSHDVGREAGGPGDHRPQRPQGDQPLHRRVHGRGDPLSLRPLDAAPADGPGRAGSGLQGGEDPGRQRLRVRHDGRQDGHRRGRPAPADADHGDDAGRGRGPDHRRRPRNTTSRRPGPRRSSTRPARATRSGRDSSWG